MNRFGVAALLTIGASLLGTSALPAQGNVLVVDSNGGPGVQFTDLSVAIQNAAPGDILDVFPGQGYLGFSTSKGVHIFCRPGVQIVGSIAVTGLPASESFTLRNSLTLVFGIGAHQISDCAGTVVLDGFNAGGTALVISRCASVHAYSVAAPYRIIDSTVSMDSCFAGGVALPTSPSPAIVVERSKLTIANSIVEGSSGTFAPPGVGIQSVSSDLTITGAPGVGSIAAGQSSTTGGPTPGIEGSGRITLDPRVAVRGALGGVAIAPGPVVTSTIIPSLTTSGSAIGGTLQVDLNGPAGEAYFIAVGLMSPQPRVVPGVVGELWLRFPSVPSLGVLDATGSTSYSASLPNAPEIVGLQFASQAVTAYAFEELRFSNPAITTFRF